MPPRRASRRTSAGSLGRGRDEHLHRRLLRDAQVHRLSAPETADWTIRSYRNDDWSLRAALPGVRSAPPSRPPMARGDVGGNSLTFMCSWRRGRTRVDSWKREPMHDEEPS